MTKKEKVTFVMEELDKLYPEIPIPLDHKDHYTLLIAVLISAQSTDARVNQITPINMFTFLAQEQDINLKIADQVTMFSKM